jgi:HTH-type transcriptional regulator/antitoxin HigA
MGGLAVRGLFFPIGARQFRKAAMNITPIKIKRDYRQALKEIEELMNAKPNTREGDRLDVLVTMVEAFERKHYPL